MISGCTDGILCIVWNTLYRISMFSLLRTQASAHSHTSTRSSLPFEHSSASWIWWSPLHMHPLCAPTERPQTGFATRLHDSKVPISRFLHQAHVLCMCVCVCVIYVLRIACAVLLHTLQVYFVRKTQQRMSHVLNVGWACHIFCSYALSYLFIWLTTPTPIVMCDMISAAAKEIES